VPRANAADRSPASRRFAEPGERYVVGRGRDGVPDDRESQFFGERQRVRYHRCGCPSSVENRVSLPGRPPQQDVELATEAGEPAMRGGGISRIGRERLEQPGKTGSVRGDGTPRRQTLSHRIELNSV
jgi:hypothetical protein